jgi:DNA-binding LacI/PurR family transcriptional regulator
MARGWESKSVEEQQNEVSNAVRNKPAVSAEMRKRLGAIESLRLQRARVVRELAEAENPRFLGLKRKELEHLDAELAKLGNE